MTNIECISSMQTTGDKDTDLPKQEVCWAIAIVMEAIQINIQDGRDVSGKLQEALLTLTTHQRQLLEKSLDSD